MGFEPMPSSGRPLEPYAARVKRPKAGRVLGTNDGARVVEVGQAKVVSKLVGEDADAAVLRLDGVVADPVVAVADPEAADRRSGPAPSGPFGPK